MGYDEDAISRHLAGIKEQLQRIAEALKTQPQVTWCSECAHLDGDRCRVRYDTAAKPCVHWVAKESY